MFISAAGFSGRRTTSVDSFMTCGVTGFPRSSTTASSSALSSRSIGRSRGSQATSNWALAVAVPAWRSRTATICLNTTRNGPEYRTRRPLGGLARHQADRAVAGVEVGRDPGLGGDLVERLEEGDFDQLQVERGVGRLCPSCSRRSVIRLPVCAWSCSSLGEADPLAPDRDLEAPGSSARPRPGALRGPVSRFSPSAPPLRGFGQQRQGPRPELDQRLLGRVARLQLGRIEPLDQLRHAVPQGRSAACPHEGPAEDQHQHAQCPGHARFGLRDVRLDLIPLPSPVFHHDPAIGGDPAPARCRR